MPSVRTRLASVFAALTGAVLAIFSVGLYLSARQAWDHDLDKELKTELREFVAHFQDEYDEFLRGIYPRLDPELEHFTELSGTQAEARRENGPRLYASSGFDRATGGPGWRTAAERVVTPRGETFQITVAVSEDMLSAHLAQLRRGIAIFCPIVLAISWALGYVFVGRTLAPVDEMRRRALRISRDNLRERIPEPRSTGEFLELARSLNEMLERLARAIEDLETFAADAAHELRTPLSNLRAEIDTVVRSPRTAEEYEQALESFAEDVDRMSRVVADLFMLAKLDLRQVAFQVARLSLAPLLAETTDTWQAAARTRNITLDVRGDAVVCADAAALRRVLMNLVENAIKYNRDGGRVSVTAEPARDRVRIRVADTGVGIAAEHLPRLFRRFYRVDKARSRETGGSGLGLAICKSFVEAQGGTISVASAPGQGTTFTVELPASAESPLNVS